MAKQTGMPFGLVSMRDVRRVERLGSVLEDSKPKGLTCPTADRNIITVMTNRTIINDYVKALTERAHQAGGVDYMAGYLHSTLLALNLQGYEIEALQKDTKILNKLVKEEEDRRTEYLERHPVTGKADRTYSTDWVMASR